ncbi:MAG TPA: MerR family transcriptional regulator [Pseudonocardiaceae bacterium]|nr:MerR family transcriptional regulator [Pseudonocardiaceae bacterium]
MRIAELSRVCGVTVPTIKYYLRDGLLPPGELTSRNQAQYDERHVRRLKLIRALVDVAGLSIAGVREALAAIDSTGDSRHNLLGAVLHRIAVPPALADDDPGLVEGDAEVTELIKGLGWHVKPDNPAWRSAAEAIATIRSLGADRLLERLTGYARAMHDVAELDLALIAEVRNSEQLIELAVLGALLGNPLLVALRRLAEEDVSARRMRTTPPESPRQ